MANYFHAILVECEENSKYQYKLVIYDNTFDDNPLEKVYAIGNIDYNITDGNKISNFIIKLEENNYDSKKVFRQLLRDYTKQFELILGQYNIKSKRYNSIGRNSVKNGRVNEGHSNGTRTNQEIGQELSAGVKENITELTEVQNGEKIDVEKFSVEYTDDNKPVVVITDNILKGVPKKDWVSTVKKTISNKFKNGIPIKGRLIKVNKDTGNEYTNSRYTQKIRSTNSTVYKNKLKAANSLDEIIISSTNYINEALNHPRKDNIKQFARGNVLMEIGNNQYSAEVIIGFTSGNNMLLYDLINLKSTSFTIKKTDASTAQQKTNSEDSRLNASATSMISQNSKNVNERFSKAADTARENITEQAEVQNDEKIKYGFAGEYAKNADLSLLDRAKLMDENGDSS